MASQFIIQGQGQNQGQNRYSRLTNAADDPYRTDVSGIDDDDVEKGAGRETRAARYALMSEGSGGHMGQQCLGGFLNFCHQCADIDEDPAGGVAYDEDEYMKKILFTGMETGLAGTYCYFFQFIIHNTYCDFIYDCHCTWTWAGGWQDCNVHNKEGKPKCPWCLARQAVEWTTNILPFLCMFAVYIYALYRRKKCDYIIARIAAATVTYFVVGAIVGLAFFLASPDYNYFFGYKT